MVGLVIAVPAENGVGGVGVIDQFLASWPEIQRVYQLIKECAGDDTCGGNNGDDQRNGPQRDMEGLPPAGLFGDLIGSGASAASPKAGSQ